MNHASLFSGIGGFDLAAEWCGWNNVFQVEIDPFCQKVLKKNFPFTEKYEDIKRVMVDGDDNLIYCDCDESPESKICAGCKDVRRWSFDTGGGSIFWDNKAGNAQNFTKKGCKISVKYSAQIKESLLQRRKEGERLCSQCVGICDTKGDRESKNTLRNLQSHREYEKWKDYYSSTSRRLQQTTESQMALSEVPSPMAQEEQGNNCKINHESLYPFRKTCHKGHKILCKRGEIDILSGGFP